MEIYSLYQKPDYKIEKKNIMTGHWNYCEDGECGPINWEGAHGQHQSPIDIDLGGVERKDTVDAIKFVNYDKILKGSIVNNGHSVQIVPEEAVEHPEIYGGGLDQVYRLVQYHFHWGAHANEGAEHRVGGLSYPAELHLVHQGIENPDRLAVVGVFLRVGQEGKALAEEEQALRHIIEPGSTTTLDHISIGNKLPKNRTSFWRYEGSLTTPPCSEIVTWTLFTEPIDVTSQQLDLLRNLKDSEHVCLKKNFRPVQKLNDRTVYHIVARH
ncbi:unnamed protein product, partial [Mesorhabditis belari]|uniref:carbonic anhydrase n=1 Tax=Mesorhabditis belari TaxID=2138241 RepID=A0AAF3EZB0_9BILA